MTGRGACILIAFLMNGRPTRPRRPSPRRTLLADNLCRARRFRAATGCRGGGGVGRPRVVRRRFIGPSFRPGHRRSFPVRDPISSALDPREIHSSKPRTVTDIIGRYERPF